MKIGLLCAIPEEAEHILQEMSITQTVEKIKAKFYEGIFMDLPVVMVVGGIGKVSSALCTQVLIDYFGVEMIIFSGIAGGLNPELNIGDTVIATETLYHDVDHAGEGIDLNAVHTFFRNRFKVEEKLIKRLQAGLVNHKVVSSAFLHKVRKGVPTKIYFGRILTGDQVITSKDRVKQLRDVFLGDCVEMEGAAVAHTCALNERPFLLIRTISDLADEEAMQTAINSMSSVVNVNYQILKAVLKIIGH